MFVVDCHIHRVLVKDIINYIVLGVVIFSQTAFQECCRARKDSTDVNGSTRGIPSW